MREERFRVSPEARTQAKACDYGTDNWGTRDTVTGDYYEGSAYNWTNFEGENPRYRESMREISSYELKQMGG